MRILRALVIVASATVVTASIFYGRKPNSRRTWDKTPVGHKEAGNNICYNCHVNQHNFTKTKLTHRRGVAPPCESCHHRVGSHYNLPYIRKCSDCHNVGDNKRSIHGAQSCTECHLLKRRSGHAYPVRSYIAYQVIKPRYYGGRKIINISYRRSLAKEIALRCLSCHHSKEDKKRRAKRLRFTKYGGVSCNNPECHGG